LIDRGENPPELEIHETWKNSWVAKLPIKVTEKSYQIAPIQAMMP
jgi:hypothetical protein